MKTFSVQIIISSDGSSDDVQKPVNASCVWGTRICALYACRSLKKPPLHSSVWTLWNCIRLSAFNARRWQVNLYSNEDARSVGREIQFRSKTGCNEDIGPENVETLVALLSSRMTHTIVRRTLHFAPIYLFIFILPFCQDKFFQTVAARKVRFSLINIK